MTPFTLYAMPHSLYSGKARSYLIKQRIDFQEVTAGHPDYEKEVMPKIGRWIIPVLKTPDGELIQDGTDIIDWFENAGKARISAYPKTGRQLITSLIFELFGGEGLLRPAMHYRWNFDETNKEFIEDQFGLFRLPNLSKEERQEIVVKSTSRMRGAAVMFGVTAETIPDIETAYESFLKQLNVHFTLHPYLLGGIPTIGDYGLIAALFAHLGRDPYPATLMKQIAPAVFRWTERMNSYTADMSEFVDMPEALLPEDDIPPTLIALFRTVAEDYLPEIRAFTNFTNDWLAAQPELQSGDIVGGDPKARAIGSCQFDWRGHQLTVGVLPYRLFLLQRIQDAFDGVDGAQKASVQQLLTEAGLEDILTLRTHRKVLRKNNREVWGEKI
ncbi:MAG: glutathione S-transferase [Proteobacteria bacterium]|nr:glutathione S-transferase [Pseudomonadota bacterium]